MKIEKKKRGGKNVHVRSATLVLHSLTVQSKEEVTNRWEKSRGPSAV